MVLLKLYIMAERSKLKKQPNEKNTPIIANAILPFFESFISGSIANGNSSAIA
mgnify:CR=1 FL=1